jgi:hypothetical protein
VYGLHPLWLAKYLSPPRPIEKRDPHPIKVLANQLLELEKLHKNKLIVYDLVAYN